MSHFTTCAIFPVESPELEKKFKDFCGSNKDLLIDFTSKKLEKPLSKYSTDLKVKPYRVYADKNEIEKMAKYFKETKLAVLAEKMDDWNGNKGGVDGKGLYYETTQNPNGRFDYWSIYDIFPVDEFLLHLNESGLVPQAILLPDCTLIESPHWFYTVSKDNAEDFNKWLDKIKNTLEKYPRSLVSLIDCHI